MLDVVLVALSAAGAAVFAGWYIYHFGSDARRTRRVLRRTRVTPIAELVDGKLACIVGRVELEGEPLRALMSARTCVAYETVVQVFTGIDMTIPSRVDVMRRLVPFFVVDATGRARIDAAEAALANEPVARSERFEERIIEDGAAIRIVGSVSLSPAIRARGEIGFREAGWSATLTGTSKFPLLIDREH